MQRSSSNVSLILPSIFHASFTTHNTFISASQVAQWERIPCSAGDIASIPDLGRSPGKGNGILLQYFCLGNPMGRRVWRATVHGVAKSQTQLSDWAHMILLLSMLGFHKTWLSFCFRQSLDFGTCEISFLDKLCLYRFYGPPWQLTW